jgi:hypothetical protein
VLGAIGIVLVYVTIFHRSADSPSTPIIPGWTDLAPCSYTTSFDGTKDLALDEDHRASRFDNAVVSDNKNNPVRGSWSFDESSKRYSVTFGNDTTVYSVLSIERAGCILVKGDLESADLRRSWFSSEDYGDTEIDQERE